MEQSWFGKIINLENEKGGEEKMAEKLKAKKVALTLAVVAGILYLACAILFAVAPEFALKLFSYMFHGIDIAQIATTTISLGNVIIGLIEIVVYALIIGWLFTKIYNRIK